jgi:hypothetical protein
MLLGELCVLIHYVCNAVIYAFAFLLFSDWSSKFQKDGPTTKSIQSFMDKNYISSTSCNVQSVTLYCIVLDIKFVVV